MKTVSIHDAKTNLSKYVAAAKRGETIYIGNHGKPEVRLVMSNGVNHHKRKLGPLAHSDLTLPNLDEDSKEWQEVINTILDGPLTNE